MGERQQGSKAAVVDLPWEKPCCLSEIG